MEHPSSGRWTGSCRSLHQDVMNTLSAFCSPPHSGLTPSADLDSVTGISYECLMGNYKSLIENPKLPIKLRMDQLNLYNFWAYYDKSSAMHNILCPEIPAALALIRTANETYDTHRRIRDNFIMTLYLLLKRPSAHRMNDVAKSVHAGMIAYIGNWIVSEGPSVVGQSIYCHPLCIPNLQLRITSTDVFHDFGEYIVDFSEENPIVCRQIAADLSTALDAARALPKNHSSKGAWAISTLETIEVDVKRSLAALDERCASPLCDNSETSDGEPLYTCSGCQVVRYCSNDCQRRWSFLIIFALWKRERYELADH